MDVEGPGRRDEMDMEMEMLGEWDGLGGRPTKSPVRYRLKGSSCKVKTVDLFLLRAVSVTAIAAVTEAV